MCTVELTWKFNYVILRQRHKSQDTQPIARDKKKKKKSNTPAAAVDTKKSPNNGGRWVAISGFLDHTKKMLMKAGKKEKMMKSEK